MSKVGGLLHPVKYLKFQREAQASHQTVEIGKGLRRIPEAALNKPHLLPRILKFPALMHPDSILKKSWGSRNMRD